MTDLPSILDQLRLLITNHAPSAMAGHVVPTAIVFLIAGIGFSVLGAKLARFSLTAGLGVIGGVLGAAFGREFVWPVPLCVLGGVIVVGSIGYLTFRLWVGVTAAAVVAAVVLSAFGYRQILPHVAEFNQTLAAPQAGVDMPALGPVAPSESQLATADAQPSPLQYATAFRDYLAQHVPVTARNATAIGIVALVTGLLLGLVAVRTTLIMSTSLIGTALVVFGLGTLLAQWTPSSYHASLAHPGAMAIGAGGFLLTSVVLQTLLTRQAATENSESRKQS